MTTNLRDAGFQESMIGSTDNFGVTETGQSFGFNQAAQRNKGFHFGFRLARMMVPKLSLAGLKIEGKTGTVYPTAVQRKVKTVTSAGDGMSSSEIEYDDYSQGIQFINRNSVFNNVFTEGTGTSNKNTNDFNNRIKRGSSLETAFGNADKILSADNGRIKLIKQAYEEAYKIQGDSIMGPGLPLNTNDFISPLVYKDEYKTGVNYHELGVESDNVRDMREIMNVIKNANDDKGLPKKENPIRYADKVFALQRDAHNILKKQIPKDLLDEHIKDFNGNNDNKDAKGAMKDILAVTPINAMPSTDSGIADVYGGIRSIATNIDTSGREQAKVNRSLKQNSVEIVKTLVNEVSTADNGILPKTDPIEAISTSGKKTLIQDGKPAYKINDSSITLKTEAHQHDFINSFDDGGKRIPSPEPDMKEVINVNSGDELRFFMRHLSEPRLRADSQSYRYIVFEWENLMKMNNDGSDIKASNQFNRIASMNASFLASSLNMLRHYVVVIVCHDGLRRQRYYANVCKTNEEVKFFIQAFDNVWSTSDLGAMEQYLFDSVFPSEGFRSGDKDVYNQVFNILPSTEFNPYTMDQFDAIYLRNKASSRDVVLRNGQIKGLKHGLQNALYLDDQGSVKFDISKANFSDLQLFLQNLPRLKESNKEVDNDSKPLYPFNDSGIWFDSGNVALDDTENNSANLLSVPRLDNEKTTLMSRLQHIEVELDTRNIVPIMNPIVLQAMLYLKHLISDIEYDTLSSVNQAGKRQTINAAMEDIFRSKGNLYIAWTFGNILTNLFTETNLPSLVPQGTGAGDRRRKIIAYRVAAQALLNATVFAHSLGRFESVYVFARDVMLKLYTMAIVDSKAMGISMAEGSTPTRVMQALYTATVFHVDSEQKMGNSDFGLTINKAGEFFNKSRRNVRLLIKDEEVADPTQLKDIDGITLKANNRVEDDEIIDGNKIPFMKHDGNIKMEKLRNKVVRSFHYWAMVLLDDDYLRTNLLGLQAGPHGGELDKMERSIKNYLGTTADLYRQQIERDGRYILPNIMSGEDKSKRQTLTDRMNKQLGDGRMITKDGQVVFSDAVGRIEVPRETLTTFDEITQNQLLQGTKVYEEGMVRAL
jgi:hypothetical protein